MSQESHGIVAATARQVSALTGQRASSVQADIIGLVLEQPPAVQVEIAHENASRVLLDRLGTPADGVATSGVSVAELRSSLTVLDARGRGPYLVPDVLISAPQLVDEEQQAWFTLFALHEEFPRNWALVGGQMVHLHCWQRGRVAPRVTTDADIIMDIRASRTALHDVSEFLRDRGFDEMGMSPAGIAHRWMRGTVTFDLLLPEGA